MAYHAQSSKNTQNLRPKQETGLLMPQKIINNARLIIHLDYESAIFVIVRCVSHDFF